MKSIYAILIACASLTSTTGSAEDLQSKQDKPSDAELKKSQRAAKSTYTIYEPNRIDRHGVVYRGTVPQAIKSRNPLQLINPFAPMEYGHGAQNISSSLPGETPKVICVSVGF